MKFRKIQPYGPDDGPEERYIYWISGIYKVVSYRPREYFAFYFRDGDANWGWRVCTPPDPAKHGGTCWSSLEAAKRACEEHARQHTPAKATVKRAAEVLAAVLRQEEESAAELRAAS